MKKRIIPILIVICLVMIIGTIYIFKESKPSENQMDLTTYYGEAVENEAILILGSEILPERAILLNGKVYLPMAVVQNSLNSVFFWDSENQEVLYASPTEFLREKVSENGETKVLNWNGNVYLQMDFVQDHTDIDVYTAENPNRVTIQYQWKDTKFVTAKNNTYVRVQADKRADVLTEVKKSEKLWYIGEDEKWYYVSQKYGLIGYVSKADCQGPEVETIERQPKESYTYISRDYKINMVWHQVTSEIANDGLDDAVTEVSGINVISPTWFSLIDENGTIQSIATQNYVENAHGRGWEVWGLVDNFTHDVDTTAALKSTASRQNIVNQLIEYALQYNLDGINIDFEYLSEEAGPYFLEFLRELSVETHKNNIVLSVDNPVPEDFTSHYDRAEQGRVVDYVIIMGYDEHYVGSDAGSVASLAWVDKGVRETLEEVPASRTINAIPFYCRVWRIQGQTLETEAIGMEDAQEVLNVNAVETYWDKEAGQNYGSYTDRNGNSCEIWVEDTESVAAKVQLVQEYDLAGVAAWKLGFETPEVWQVISNHLYNSNGENN